MNLVIVESPAKAKTINQYLGKNFLVLASYGHVRDLPNKNGSVIPEKNFEMLYEPNSNKKSQIQQIKNSLNSGDILWLATDSDREGEAIAWHIKSILDNEDKLKNIEIKRVIFNEITKSAILEAFGKPSNININMVNAYQARRALDYLMGFTLSPVLWRALPRSKSAGRVQSVALKLVCERETEIEAFKSIEYWSIESIFETKKQEKITTYLYAINEKKLNKLDIGTLDEANKILEKIKNNSYVVKNTTKKRIKRNPAPPFITSTLQQEASRKLGFNATHTMSVAQSLYEGVKIQGETVGLITYMRTDSVNLSNFALKKCNEVIHKIYGSEYTIKIPRKYKNKSRNAQEAHEAIRPTDPCRTPKGISKFLNDNQKKLYELIWNRTIACQMQNAEIDQVTINITSNDNKFYMRTSGSNTFFDGFMKVYTEGQDDKNTKYDEKDKVLPHLNDNEKVTYITTNNKQHFTEPPPRFTEATLVKKLEELGIGRPSTYANIVFVIRDKGYVRFERKRFIPESKGRLVTSFLSGYFSKYVGNDFTANLELKLDQISQGKDDWKEVLNNWWIPYKQSIDTASSLRVKDVVEKIDNDLGPHFFPENKNGEDPRKCPKCQKGKLKIQYGRYGGYIGCSNYPNCKFNSQLIVGDKESKSIHEPLILGQNENKENITLRNGPYGYYIQLGDSDEHSKPKRVSLPKSVDTSMFDLEQALKYLSLPRKIGNHPETGNIITAGIGRYGPYIKYDKTFFSLPKEENIFEIGINRAVDILSKPKKKFFKKK